MPFILDTCSISEFVSRKPHPGAVKKLTQLPREEIHLSTITIGELEQGITELEDGKHKRFLRSWLDDHVLVVYAQRTIPVDTVIARQWGVLSGTLKVQGLAMQVKDALIAATALVHNLVVVTRNEADFARSGVQILNPWK